MHATGRRVTVEGFDIEASIVHVEKLLREEKNLSPALPAAIEVLLIIVRLLVARLGLNSRNSSKPPSSDGYQKPQPKSRRQKSGRRNGGQPGHPGSTLKQVEHPDHTEVCKVDVCSGCGEDLSTHPVDEVERRQVFDLPPFKIHITEFRVQIKTCGRCGARRKAPCPQASQPVQYGARVQGTVSYLSQYQLLPYERLQELMHDLFQLDLSQGTIENALHRGYEKLEPFDQEVKQQIVHSDVAGFDQTGMRVIKELYWLHAASTDTLTAYHIDAQRGRPAMDTMGILPRFTGTAVHDGWASYYAYENCDHVLCNAHHLRELTCAEEQHQQQWAARMKGCLEEANEEVKAAEARGATALPAPRSQYFSDRYSRILREGRQELPQLPDKPSGQRGRARQHKVKNLHDRLRDHKAEALAFMYDFSIPFTNNQSEQAVRMAKVKQKISGCFRSLHGARMFASFRGYICTAKKQEYNICEALTALFEDRTACVRRLTEPIS